MKLKTSMVLIALGVGGTLMYQNIKNGNMKCLVKKMSNAMNKASNTLEDMM